MKVRIRLPATPELSAFGVALVGHVALLLLIIGIGGARSSPGRLGPAMTVRLAGPRAVMPRGGTPTGSTAPTPKPSAAPAPKAPEPPVRTEKLKPTVRTKAGPEPRNVVTRPTGATAQPETLPTVKPTPHPEGGGEAAKRGASAGPSGLPGLPGGPIPGGIAGLSTGDPSGADWYEGLIVNRLQDAWRDRPLLPEGAAQMQVVVSFVIEKDGRVTDPKVATPSGYTPLDMSALRAVTSLGKLPPLPAGYPKDRSRKAYVFELVPAE